MLDGASDTILRAAGSFGAFGPRRGSARAWLFEFAAHVWAGYCAHVANSRDAMVRAAGYRTLEVSEIDELAAKIDAQRAGGSCSSVARVAAAITWFRCIARDPLGPLPSHPEA